MSAYTRWLAEYTPVKERLSALVDEVDAIKCEIRKLGPGMSLDPPNDWYTLKAKTDEMNALLAQQDQMFTAAPEPSLGNELWWLVEDFVRESPYFPTVVAAAFFAALVGVVLLVT